MKNVKPNPSAQSSESCNISEAKLKLLKTEKANRINLGEKKVVKRNKCLDRPCKAAKIRSKPKSDWDFSLVSMADFLKDAGIAVSMGILVYICYILYQYAKLL